jgi:membrane protease subunit (stomatin/prohibitin family)
MKVATPILTKHVPVIEWPEDTIGTLVSRFPMDHADIQYGAKLNVRDFQQAIFVVNDQFADIFNPGLYTLTRESMPRLSVFLHWDEHPNDSFPADIYFIKTKYFIDQQWCVKGHDKLRKICGTFDIKIINARKVIQKLVASSTPEYFTDDARIQVERVVQTLLPDALKVERVVQTLLPDALKQSKIKSQEELHDSDVAAFIQESVNVEFNDYGLMIRNLVINIGKNIVA